jgi:hypothetical protein
MNTRRSTRSRKTPRDVLRCTGDGNEFVGAGAFDHATIVSTTVRFSRSTKLVIRREFGLFSQFGSGGWALASRR